ncbi:ATP-binding protein [Streptomyces sp. NPDC088747]|uniref:ATP-binding protein n=1 Tax=Streptomyces sp. NPDC088747 TaxID=3365886 RepID=UPI0037F5EA7C
MSDRVPLARPVTHRRGRGRRIRTDRYLLDEVTGVLVAPLLCIAVLSGITVLAAWVYELSTSLLAICLGGSVFVTALVGALRVQAAAASLQRHRDAELRQIVEASSAAEKTLVWTAGELCRGVRPMLPPDPPRAGSDLLEKVFEVIGDVRVQGVASLLRVHDESQAAVVVAMHQTLTRRQHSLIDEMLGHLTSLQRATEDPELLDQSFKIDHLATRLRRMVESVSVVLGGTSLRETRTPVPVATVLRGAKSEVVKYTRVQTAAGEVGSAFALPAHVHPDVAHLLAELIDNGVENSDPASKVVVRAQKVARGLLIEVEDRAVLQMDPDKRDVLNHLLENPGQADVSGQVRAGCLGLITTAKIAARHGLRVWLAVNPTGGTTASVVVPDRYLVSTAPAIGTVTVSAEPPSATPRSAQAGTALQRTASVRSAAIPAQRADVGDTPGLPRRKRVARPMPTGPAAGPAGPPQAANPQAAADWRSGLNAGLQSDSAAGTTPHPRS